MPVCLPEAAFPNGYPSAHRGISMDAADRVGATPPTGSAVPEVAFTTAKDLVQAGDGGFWMAHVLMPMFQLMAQEVRIVVGGTLLLFALTPDLLYLFCHAR
jgi:hypothetical protein